MHVCIKKDHIVDTSFYCTAVWRLERWRTRFLNFVIFSMSVFLTMLYQCSDVNPSSQRILPTMRRSRDDSTQMVYFNWKKDHIVGSLLLACRRVPMLMKYTAGLQKSYLRIFYPPLPLSLLFLFIFLFFSITLNNFYRKLGFFKFLPSKSCISAKNACTERILGSFER